MTDIVKVCKKHGELSIENIHAKGKSKSGKKYYACTLCKREIAKKYYTINFDKVSASKAIYDKQKRFNPIFKEKRKKWDQDYYKRKYEKDCEAVKNKWRIYKKTYRENHPERIKELHKKMRDNLTITYVRNYLKFHYKFDDPPSELIHAKATLMLLRREIMTMNAHRGKHKYVKKKGCDDRRVQSGDAERDILNPATENIKKS